MEKIFLSVLLTVCLLMNTGVESAADSNVQGDCIVVTRATGEIEKYELVLDDMVSIPNTDSSMSSLKQQLDVTAERCMTVNIPSNNDLFMPNAEASMSVDIPSNNALFTHNAESANDTQPGNAAARASARNFNWSCAGDMLTYSTTILYLNKGDTIAYLFSTNTAYSLQVGLRNNDTREFTSAWYHGSTNPNGSSVSSSMIIGISINASFAINNLGSTSVNCNGSYTHP